MAHADPDTLALRALGEPISAEDVSHLAECAVCQSELDQLRAVVSTARRVTSEDAPEPPPDRVWLSVADELGVASSDRRPELAPAESSRRPTRRLVYLVGAAAAVVGLVLGGLAATVAVRATDGDVLATTALGPVDAGDAHGTATLRATSAGRQLEVDVHGLPSDDGYYEVWFMNAQTGGAVSLGSLDPSHPTTFDVPEALRLEDFPYVDISLEPLDGNPAHSTDSVARGRMVA